VTGRFIVVEGIDGAGTTTLAKSLAATMRGARFTCEPSDGPVGVFLRDQLAADDILGPICSPDAMALLFAADRMHHIAATIDPMLYAGLDVICDRYLLSSMCYQSIGFGDVPARQAWLKTIQPWVRIPDVTLLISVSPETAKERRDARGGAVGVFDCEDAQAELAELYSELPDTFAEHCIVVLDGEAPPWLVLSRALRALEHVPNR